CSAACAGRRTTPAAARPARRVRPARRRQRPAGGGRLRAGQLPAVSLCPGAAMAAASLAFAVAADRRAAGWRRRRLGHAACAERLAVDRAARSLKTVTSRLALARRAFLQSLESPDPNLSREP